MKPLSLLILSMSAVAAVSSAQAASTVSASANITGLTLTLVDLDPLDGIAPSITFGSYGYYDNYGYVSANQFDGTSYGSDYAEFGSTTTNPWTPGAVSANSGVASAAASLTGNGGIDGSSLLTSGSASAVGVVNCTVTYPYQTCGQPYSSFGSQVTSPYYYYSGTVTVAANTLVLIEAQGAVMASAEGGGTAQSFDYQNLPYTYYYGNGAYAQLNLSISGPAASGSGGGSQSSSDSLSMNSSTYWDGTQWLSYSYGSATTSGSLGISFVNASDADMLAALNASAYVYGYAYGDSVAAVPEPGTYAMLMAGLLSIGAVVRRRRQG